MSATIFDLGAEAYGLSTAPFVVLCIALTFFGGGLVFIGGVFASRILKSHYERRALSLRSQYQKVLNKIVVNESYSVEGAPDGAFEFYMAELRLITGASRFARQLLLNRILEVKKSLTGNSAKALDKTYYAMSLYQESLSKLRAVKWQTRALAIRELAEMGYNKGTPFIVRFLYSRNQTLREESLMALVRLEDQPLAFLNGYQGELSLWMRITIYRHLQRFDHRRLPLFSAYFNHPNTSVRLFAVSMARRFKQSASVPGLVELLYSDNAKLVGVAIAAIGELEAFQHRDVIARLALHVWRYPRLSRRAVECLGNIGDKETDVALVGRFLDHPAYEVRFAAVSALKQFGDSGEALLEQFRAENPERIDAILRHLSEPLLT